MAGTMPKREDIHTIMIIGAGPIVIGQACEFDYSGTQAVKTLKEGVERAEASIHSGKAKHVLAEMAN